MCQTLFRLFALAAALLLPLGILPTAAQEASPAAEVEMGQLPPGVGAILLAQLASVELPETATLSVVWFTLDPGAEVPVHPHPAMEIAVVQEGSGSIRTFEGPAALLIRAGAAVDATPEAYGPGEELTFTAGDVVIVPAGNMSDGRGGDQGATALIFEFAPEEAIATPEA